jgi:ribonuclease HI
MKRLTLALSRRTSRFFGFVEACGDRRQCEATALFPGLESRYERATKHSCWFLDLKQEPEGGMTETAKPRSYASIGGTAAHGGLHIFVDGCFEPKSRQGGWAFVACRDDVEIASGFGGVENSANNAMEAMALLQALLWVDRNASAEPAIIWSDSRYAVDGCNNLRLIWRHNGWKKIDPNQNARRRTIADAEIWKAIDAQLDRNRLLTVSWCKGHSGNDGNERADQLAELGRLSTGASTRSL